MLQGGVSTNQTGLTIGSTYYVQPDGTLATTIGSPKVEAGKALSATSLFLSDKPVVVGTADFVASGTLPNGAPVVLKSDGTVEAAALVSTTLAESIPAGSEYAFNTANPRTFNIAFDPNNANKFVVVYRVHSNSGYGTAVVGTISGTTLTFGTEVVFNAGATYFPDIAFDPNTAGKFVVIYRDNANTDYATAKVGTLSGTSVSFGTAVVFNSGTTYYQRISFDPNTAGKFVISYRNEGNSGYGTAIVGTLSGTTATFGTSVVFYSGTTGYLGISFDPNTAGKFVIAYRNGTTTYGEAIVGTVAGTSVSFGTAVSYNSVNSGYNKVSFDPNTAGKFVVAYKNGTTSYGEAIVGTVAGTSVSFGTAVVFNSAGNTGFNAIAFDPNTAGKFVISFDRVYSPYNTAVVVGTLSGTSVSFGTVIEAATSSNSDDAIAFDPNNAGKFVVVYYAGTEGAAVVGQIAATVTSPTLTSTNFLGTSQAAYTDTQTASIMLQGSISANQTGLTIGSTYYVQPDGTLTTSAGTPSVIAGKAISATSLLLKGI